MGKNKLARWTELGSYPNVIQPAIVDIVYSSGVYPEGAVTLGNIMVKDHPVKGKWNETIFRNNNPIVLELGCGRGEYTTGLAERFPGKNFIGIDIKGARMWKGARTSNEKKLVNAAFLRTRIEFINSFFGENEADEIWVTFPDPHVGARNANKRLTSPWYLNLYKPVLKDKGIIHLKTDNAELHRYTRKVAENNSLRILFSTEDLYSENLPDEILSIRTHYEQMFLATGLKITYLAFMLDKNSIII